MGSALVVEFEIVDADGIAVLDAHFLQPFEEAGFAELTVEIVAGFEIAEVDIADETGEPLAFDDPGLAVLADASGGLPAEEPAPRHRL